MGPLPWVLLPYASFVSFVVGHIWRYRRDRFELPQRDEDRLQRVGLAMFRGGMLVAVVAHVVELLVPAGTVRAARIADSGYHLTLLSIEVVAAIAAFVGVAILLAWIAPTSAPHTGFGDKVVLPILVVGLLTGMAILFEGDPGGIREHSRAMLFAWFRSLFTADPQPELMAHAPLLYQTRALVVLAIIAIWPYTRLVYIFTVPIGYLIRATARVRRRIARRRSDID